MNESRQKFSDMIEKELLERAGFLMILLKDYKEALKMQKKLCEINQKLYVD
jgi:hypothetical protein